jgi:hypothetical protein
MIKSNIFSSPLSREGQGMKLALVQARPASQIPVAPLSECLVIGFPPQLNHDTAQVNSSDPQKLWISGAGGSCEVQPPIYNRPPRSACSQLAKVHHTLRTSSKGFVDLESLPIQRHSGLPGTYFSAPSPGSLLFKY